MLTTIILVILIIMLLGALPAWPHMQPYGAAPANGLVIVLIIVIVLIAAGVF